MRYLLLSIVLIVLSADSVCGYEITFFEKVEVESSELSLGDIVSFHGDHETTNALKIHKIGAAPAPGKTISVDARRIIREVHRTFDDLPEINWTGHATVTVYRKGNRITGSEIDQLLTDYLKRNNDKFRGAQVKHTIESLPAPFYLPTGTFECDIIPANPQIIGSKRVSLIFKVDGKVIKNLSIHCRIEAYAKVVVARNRIKYGTILNPAELMLRTMELSRLEDYATSIDQVAGTIAKRAIRKGVAIQSSMIESAPIVRRGELVKIIINYQGLFLTATGVAKANGKKNDVIRVRNSSSNKIIHCRVQAPGLVEVTL